MIYYNEFDEPTAWWLKGLSDNGVIPKGFVDTRSLDNFNHTIKNEYLAANAFGNTELGKKAQMGSPLCLNPEISRWLMGFPIEFSNIVDMVMQSYRK